LHAIIDESLIPGRNLILWNIMNYYLNEGDWGKNVTCNKLSAQRKKAK
jgi:hypothetical protein